MDLSSYLKEGTDPENSEIKEETVHSPTTLDNEEVLEKDENFELSQLTKDPEALESVQKYANRIKSFLGWEPYRDEGEYKTEQEEVKDSGNVGHLYQSLTDSSLPDESIDKEKNKTELNFDIENVHLDEEEGEERNHENKTESVKIYERISPEKNKLIKNIEECLKTKDIDKSEQCTTQMLENIGNKIGKNTINNDDDDGNNDRIQINSKSNFTDNTEKRNNTDTLVSEIDSQSMNNSLLITDNIKIIKPLQTDDISFRKAIDIPSEINKPEDILVEDSMLTENQSHDINSQLLPVDTIASTQKIDLLTGKDKNKTDNEEPKEMDSSNNLSDEKRNDKDDLRSEDSLDMDDDFPLKNDFPKQYVKDIRRLSREIVKNIIETARNSVHELHTDKSEVLDISEKLNSNCAKDDTEKNLDNTNAHSDTTSKFNTIAFPKEKNNELYDNSELTKDQIEEELAIDDKDTVCGYGCFKPKWIQQYATPRAFLILFSVIGIFHGCYYTYIVSILSTLEKRYAFKTKTSGVLLIADEITPLILGIIVGYIGGRTHRPRWVALGMFLSATSCFLSGLPYLIYGEIKHFINFGYENESDPEFCDNSLRNSHCNADERPPTLTVVGILIFASFLKGFASLSYYVIGMSYMDDIIKRKNSPMYFAIAIALRLLGPLVGFLMSSGFLKFYENPFYDPGFGPDDPRWIGAWWIGFFVQGVLLVIFAIPIALFPRRLPGQKKVEKTETTDSEGGLKEICTGLISALKRLGRNPVFIVLIINTIMQIFGHFGHIIMLPKFMENQFRLSASEASLYCGAITIGCMIMSTLLGGFLIWKFRPTTKLLFAGMITSEIIVCIVYLVLIIPRCQPLEMLHFGMNEEGLILNSVCNKNCDCSTSSFTPFCGPDGKTLYFSPCYAGCTEQVTSSMFSKMSKEYSNCSCVDQHQVGTTVSEGFCPDENCRSQMLAYLIIFFFLVTMANLFTVAQTLIVLRSVHPSDKSMALGTFEAFICLFALIPCPVTFGALVDSACLVWEKSCGETGNCWFYDLEKYGYLVHGAAALFCFLSVLCLIILYCLSSRIRNLYIEEDEEIEIKDVDIKLDTVSGSVTKL